MVACDGAKSTVRKFLGIESEGENACGFNKKQDISQPRNLIKIR